MKGVKTAAETAAQMGARLTVGAGFAAWFWLIYGGANWWTARQPVLHDIRTGWDDLIPFLPGWSWLYMTVSLILILPLLVLSFERVLTLAFVLAAEVALAGIIYLIWPVAPLPHPALPGHVVYAFADLVNLTYNAAPSLHVALSVTCACYMAWAMRGGAAALGLVIWAAGIVVATLVTHQHYLLDALSGVALAGVGLAGAPLISTRVKKSAISRRISGI